MVIGIATAPQKKKKKAELGFERRLRNYGEQQCTATSTSKSEAAGVSKSFLEGKEAQHITLAQLNGTSDKINSMMDEFQTPTEKGEITA